MSLYDDPCLFSSVTVLLNVVMKRSVDRLNKDKQNAKLKAHLISLGCQENLNVHSIWHYFHNLVKPLIRMATSNVLLFIELLCQENEGKHCITKAMTLSSLYTVSPGVILCHFKVIKLCERCQPVL